MEPEKTKVKIDSKKPYIKNFNGQQASATAKVGAETGRQLFDLPTIGGGLYLDPDDYQLV